MTRERVIREGLTTLCEIKSSLLHSENCLLGFLSQLPTKRKKEKEKEREKPQML